MLSAPQTSKGNVTETKRSKIVLLQGRSLMDWIRLAASKRNMVRIKKDVDHVELSKHSSVDDCWILLNDKVYNVTEYLSFHPGGIEQLMRAAGTDGTNLFNESRISINSLSVPGPKAFNSAEEASSDIVNFEKTEIRAEAKSANQLLVSCSKWDQLKDENISLEYTENTLRLLLHFSSGKTEALHWTDISATTFIKPFRVSVDNQTISFSCKEGDINANVIDRWTSGTYHNKPGIILLFVKETMFLFRYTFESVFKYRSCEIFEMHNITHDMRSVILRMASYCRLMVPVGHHVFLRISVNGSLIERPYTPIMVSEDGQFISFMIKFYENGVFTSKLRGKKCGDLIEISDPQGCFDVQSNCSDVVIMLAAGAGLTPMIRFTAERLKSEKKAIIILFNKKEIDIVPDDCFTKCKISLKHPSLEILHVLSESENDWKGEKGTVSKQVLLKYVAANADRAGYRVFVSGPDPFIDLALRLLDELGISLENVYVFQN
uniref:Cytochrome-b5 reductase n=1 Tax=Setaria digitata TaxID=48799 RepID=A0A915Q2J9_9BILA